jgi:hypothetical protein
MKSANNCADFRPVKMYFSHILCYRGCNKNNRKSWPNLRRFCLVFEWWGYRFKSQPGYRLTYLRLALFSPVPPGRFWDTTSVLATTPSSHTIRNSSLSAYRKRTSGRTAEEEGEENVPLSKTSRRSRPALGPTGLLPNGCRRHLHWM